MNTLQTKDLCATVSATMGRLNEQARLRIRAEMATRHISQQDIAGMVQWSQSRVAQKLSGRTPITLNELEALCFAVGIAPTEAVRDPGLEFCADMTPTELRMLQQFRQTTEGKKNGILALLDVRVKTAQPQRYAHPAEPPIKAPRAKR